MWSENIFELLESFQMLRRNSPQNLEGWGVTVRPENTRYDSHLKMPPFSALYLTLTCLYLSTDGT